MAQLILANSIRVVDLVSEDQERNLSQLLHGKESVELGLGLGETLVVLGVNEEDDTANFGEVVLPQTTSYLTRIATFSFLVSIYTTGLRGVLLTLLVTTQVEGREAVVADGEFFGCCIQGVRLAHVHENRFSSVAVE